jgi:ribose transport system substrate-binding protein
MDAPLGSLGRRGFLAGALGLGGAAALSACTSNTPAGGAPAAGPAVAPAGDNAEAGQAVTIGFSAPAADHGWIAAIANNAAAQAEQYPDVTLEAVNPTNDITAQIAAVQTLINRGVDALVILPNDGSQLTSVGRQAMEAGIPVINLDRIFDSPLAYRTWIGGDNYGMGVSAGNYVGQRLREAGVANPVIGEIAGIDNLPLTQQRSQGFADALAAFGFSVGPRQAADFTAQGGQRSPPTCCRPRRSSTRSGTTTTTRASACSPRSSRPGAASSSWSAGPARPTPCARSRPTTPCSRRR